MEKPKRELSNQEAKSQAELKKLNLEIGILERQHPLIEGLVKLVPVATTLVAVVGLLFTYTQATNVQREERINKIFSQIRADKEQILDFITNEKTSSVRAAFLIDDLNNLVGQLSEGKDERKMITEHLMRVAWELPFDQRRDFDFDVSALKQWKQYRLFWQLNPGSHKLFLDQKYYPRLRQLHTQEPACIENLDYREGTEMLTYEKALKPCQEVLTNAFFHGFLEHLNVIKEANSPELLNIELEEYKKITNDSPFGKRLKAIYLK